MKKLALVGYGKMGKMIEQLAPEYGFEVALRLDEFNNANYEGITATNFAGMLDKALFRRFDDVIRYEPPDPAMVKALIGNRLSSLDINI